MAYLAAETVPAFNGEAKLPDGSVCMPIREFLQRVDAIKASTGSNEQVTAAAVKQKLCGAAYTLVQVAIARGVEGLDCWNDLAAQGNDAAVPGLRSLLKGEFQKEKEPRSGPQLSRDPQATTRGRSPGLLSARRASNAPAQRGHPRDREDRGGGSLHANP